METAAAMRRPPNPVSESSSGRTYADSILGSIVLMAIAELCNVDEPSGAQRDPGFPEGHGSFIAFYP